MTHTSTYQLDIPTSDSAFLKKLAEKMGWMAKKISSARTTELDKAIKAARTEPLHTAENVEELMKQLCQ